MAIQRPGKHFDKDGLYLNVKATGAASWVQRYTTAVGQKRSIGLGPLDLVSLADARKKGLTIRKQAQDGLDPLANKSAKSQPVIPASRCFRSAAEECIADRRAEWRGERSHRQWSQSLEKHAYPIVGELNVAEIGLDHILQVLRPIWAVHPETASRIRQRIEDILDREKVLGNRTGENPARWRGHLDTLFAAKEKVRAVKHFEALPYSEIPSFMKKLRSKTCASARALEFLILCVSRTSEVTGGLKDEVDVENRNWTIPGARMKTGKPHRVPLSNAALAILKKQNDTAAAFSPHLFTAAQTNEALSNAAMYQFLKKLGYPHLTVHGFRSTFRDWAADTTRAAREDIEMCLGHAVAGGSEQSYWRSDLFKKRSRLIERWAKYCQVAKNADV